jgi:aryl-alcohol dehydrogenase-like predicted oxidoreductase
MQPKNIKETIRRFQLVNAGRRIPFGVGCAWLHDGYPDRAAVKEHLKTFAETYELGFRYYDTARAYGNSEWVTGEFVASVPRDSIFLATKFYLPRVDGVTPQEAVEQSRGFLHESLARLRTDHLDLYQVHDSWRTEYLFAEGGVLEFLLDARRQGLIRHFGMAVREQKILRQALANENFDTILTWGDFSPFNQSGAEMIAQAEKQGVGVINASPLYGARNRGLDFNDPRVLAAVLQYPLTNPGIDMTLTGPSNIQEIRATVAALHETVDRGLWEDWKSLSGAD